MMKTQDTENKKQKKAFVEEFAKAVHECLFEWDPNQRMVEWDVLTDKMRGHYIAMARHLSNKFMVKFRELPPEQNEVTIEELANEIHRCRKRNPSENSWLELGEMWRNKRRASAKKLLSLFMIEHRDQNTENGVEGLYRLLLPDGFHREKSDEWMQSKDYAKKVGMSEDVLQRLRSCEKSVKTNDRCFGRDKRGNVWARQRGCYPVFYYLGEYREIVTWCLGEEKIRFEVEGENHL